MSEFQFFKLAGELNEKHHSKLKKAQCHFRGGFGGVSLISLTDKKPELGISGIDAVNAECKIREIGELKPPRRVTPEKELQAWLINQVIFGSPPDFWSERQLQFLTSEIRVKHQAKNVVNDILAIDAEGALWVIELKSGRALSELIKQVNNFTDALKSRSEFFQQLVSVINPGGAQWDGSTIKKMIVWPEAKDQSQARTKNLLEEHDIHAVSYRRQYDFLMES
jgi:hypothetical protein